MIAGILPAGEPFAVIEELLRCIVATTMLALSQVLHKHVEVAEINGRLRIGMLAGMKSE
ncbi:hypothetical protein [Rhizobium sullae]